MFGFVGSISFGKELLESLVKASKNDVLGDGISHSDGWGYALFSNITEKSYRSTKPIYVDDSSQIFDRFQGKLCGVFHARYSAPNEPKIGPFDSHPFQIRTGAEIAYLAHNGWIDKKKIGEKFSMPYEMNDTEVFASWVERLDGTFIKRMEEGIDFVKNEALLGSLNLICVIEKRDGTKGICYYSKYKEEKLYYQLYTLEQGKNFAVMSSTMAYYLKLLDKKGNILNKKLKTVEQEKLFYKFYEK
jgi:glutamine amidotransferase